MLRAYSIGPRMIHYLEEAGIERLEDLVGAEQQAIQPVEQRPCAQRQALRQEPVGRRGGGKAHAELPVVSRIRHSCIENSLRNGWVDEPNGL